MKRGELRRNDWVDDSSVHSALDPAVEVLSHFNLDGTVLSVAVLDDDLVEVSLQEFSAAALNQVVVADLFQLDEVAGPSLVGAVTIGAAVINTAPCVKSYEYYVEGRPVDQVFSVPVDVLG